MSPDNIFAATLWPWPDPLLKRDASGRILFVNAAFLQLYGGSVEDWQGNAVSGWPTPNVQATPYRFEVQAGDVNAPQIYDWVEVALADGAALAMGRNVTDLLAAATAQVSASALATETQSPAQTHEAGATQAEIAQDLQPQIHQQFEAPQEQVLVKEQAPLEAQVEPEMEAVRGATDQVSAPVAPQLEHAQLAQHTEMASPEISEPVLSEPVINVPELDHTVTPAPQGSEAVMVTSSTAQQAETDRDFERRALPLESDSSVLGVNWRDEVIAKAVGEDTKIEPIMEKPAEGVSELTNASDDTTSQDQDKGLEETDEKAIRILLAEDNAINALLTRTLLEAEGCIVDTVEDGALALDAVKKSNFDLIFMDMRMPNMDGLESTRKIRALGGKHLNMPIIALTANAFDDDRNACFDSGMNDFMTKPVSAEELSEMVRTWTQNREQRMAS